MKNAHGRTCKKTKVYIYLYISLYENLFENGCIPLTHFDKIGDRAKDIYNVNKLVFTHIFWATREQAIVYTW